jgi:outer membrane protein assembly factor BamB
VKGNSGFLISRTCRLGLAIAAAASSAAACATDWLQFGFDASHSGYNPAETSIASNLDSLQLSFATPLPAKSDDAPVYAVVQIGGASRGVVFVTTIEGHLVAIDARSGEVLWIRQPATGPMQSTQSAPVIDPDREHVYGFGLDGKVHKYEIASGDEVVDTHWPETVTLKPDVEKGSSALTFATAASGTTYLYAATSNISDDAGDYQGHITAIDLQSGEQAVFNTLCSNRSLHFVHSPKSSDCLSVRSGIWGRPAVAYDGSTDRIYVTTGNGPYSGNSGGYDWGQSVLALTPSLRDARGHALLLPLDSYTPPEYAALNAVDSDLGQTIPALLPAPVGSSVAHLGAQIGKDGIIRLLDLSDMSGKGGPGHLGGDLQQIPGLDFVPFFSSQPAVWVDPATATTWLFAVNNGAAYAFNLVTDEHGKPGLVQVWARTDYGGSSAVVADGLVFYADQSLRLIAVDALTGQEKWSTPMEWAHWASPIVVDGSIFIADATSTLKGYSVQQPLVIRGHSTHPSPPALARRS